MTALVAVAADLLVAILLVATIVTARKLSARMAAMKADETSMRTTIRELVTAADAAERAIGGLRSAVQDSERVLGDRLSAAARHSTRLADQVAAGEAVLDRVSQVAGLSRRVEAEARAPEPSDRALRATIMAARDVAFRSAGRPEERAA